MVAKKTNTIINRSILIGLLLCSISGNIAQTFENSYRSLQDDVAYEALQTGNGNFILTTGSGDYYKEDYVIKLFLMDDTGMFLDSIKLVQNPDYKYLPPFKLLHYHDNIILLGNCFHFSSGDCQLYITHLTESFKPIFDTIVGKPNLSENMLEGIIDSDTNIVVTGGTMPLSGTKILAVYDLNGNQLRYREFNETSQGGAGSALIEVEEFSKYHLYFYYDTQLKRIFVLDKVTLNTDTVYKFPQGFFPRNALWGSNKESYFISGRFTNPSFGPNRTPTMLKVSKYGDTISHDYYLQHPDTNSLYSLNSFDFESDFLFLANTYNFTETPPLMYPEPRWIWLMKLNLDGSLVWQHFYKGEVNYMPYKVLATSDGGALVLSTRYDWNDSIPNQRDVHILKVDSNGWYPGIGTGINEFEEPQQILVYPNPVRDKVKFVTGWYKDLELAIYDMQGNKVFAAFLPGTREVDLSFLRSGVYVYRLTGKDGFAERGKIVKE